MTRNGGHGILAIQTILPNDRSGKSQGRNSATAVAYTAAEKYGLDPHLGVRTPCAILPILRPPVVLNLSKKERRASKW